ncbi:MAG: hypothetical protein JWL70_1067 [Acidimicrobiia bacterium]|nr:hypothetical protein [Acidimicrobiia bacterium]
MNEAGSHRVAGALSTRTASLVLAGGVVALFVATFETSRRVAAIAADADYSPAGQLASYQVVYSLLLVGAYALVRWRHGRVYPLHLAWSDGIAGASGFTVARSMGLILWLVCAVARVPFAFTKPVNHAFDSGGGFVLLTAVVLVAAPIAEEVFFRGLLLPCLEGVAGERTAIGLQAAVFGLAHFDSSLGSANVPLCIEVAFAGAVFGWLVKATGRLGPAAVAHVLFNVPIVLMVALR